MSGNNCFSVSRQNKKNMAESCLTQRGSLALLTAKARNEVIKPCKVRQATHSGQQTQISKELDLLRGLLLFLDTNVLWK